MSPLILYYFFNITVRFLLCLFFLGFDQFFTLQFSVIGSRDLVDLLDEGHDKLGLYNDGIVLAIVKVPERLFASLLTSC